MSSFNYSGFASIRYFAIEVSNTPVDTHDMKVVKPRKVKNVNWTEEGFERAYSIQEGIPYVEKEVVKVVETPVVKYVKRKLVNVNFGVDVDFSNY